MRLWKDKNKRRHYQSYIRELKAVRRRKSWLKSKRGRLEGKTHGQREFQEVRRQAQQIKAPEVFSINRNPNGVFEFIGVLKNYKNRSNFKGLFIALTHCEYISNGAIALMISAIKELKLVGVKVSGNYPRDKAVRTILEKSGFFNFVIGYVSEENKITLNTIIQQGFDVVDSAAVAPLVLKAMNVVWGKFYRNPKIQSLLIELMANTVNHAFAENKKSKWYLSISSDQS